MPFKILNIVPLLCLAAGAVFSTPSSAANASDFPFSGDNAIIENEYCRIAFDGRTGSLQSITNRKLSDECLKNGTPGAMPFQIYADLTKEFEVGTNEKYQLVFEEPTSITNTIVQPGICRAEANLQGSTLTIRYHAKGLEVQLGVQLAEDSGSSDWSLRITNTGNAPREFLACFPYLDGVRLGPNPAKNMATAMDQAGLTVPAWERRGGVLGESNQLSMQWHAIWDPPSRSALALLFMDAQVRPKRLVLSEPSIALQHFPPVKLAPGTSIDLPSVRVLVYQGDWRPAARAYRAWHTLAYPHVEAPAWFRASNGNTGIHFKRGGASSYTGQLALDSFADIPAAHIQAPIDNWEYAFYCRSSMMTEGFTPHTDGDNIIREDLGGADAMRQGIAGVHRLGLHTTLYVEGYIIHETSDLAKSGKGRLWAVMRKDGTITCPYSNQGFIPMCVGCTEWQDHLAQMAARLLRETNADAIRLDSLGFYYLPCYNPAHHHDSPFGYNDWLMTLLAKVRQAAIAVKPDVALLTEGSADWFCPWFHGALTSRCPRDLAPMRIALASFRPYVYASGALWGSLSGFPGGDCAGSDISTMDWNWLCARFPAHEALVYGNVADADPASSDPEIVTRCFEGEGYWAVVAARPASQDPIWPRGTTIAAQHRPFTVTVQELAPFVEDAALCDVETLTWAPLAVEKMGNDVRFTLETNWALVILRRIGGPILVSFDPLPSIERGSSTTVNLTYLSLHSPQPPSSRIALHAPGLDVTPRETTVSGGVVVTAPRDALPGNYPVSVSGNGVLGVKRFLVVR